MTNILSSSLNILKKLTLPLFIILLLYLSVSTYQNYNRWYRNKYNGDGSLKNRVDKLFENAHIKVKVSDFISNKTKTLIKKKGIPFLKYIGSHQFFVDFRNNFKINLFARKDDSLNQQKTKNIKDTQHNIIHTSSSELNDVKIEQLTGSKKMDVINSDKSSKKIKFDFKYGDLAKKRMEQDDSDDEKRILISNEELDSETAGNISPLKQQSRSGFLSLESSGQNILDVYDNDNASVITHSNTQQSLLGITNEKNIHNSSKNFDYDNEQEEEKTILISNKELRTETQNQNFIKQIDLPEYSPSPSENKFLVDSDLLFDVPNERKKEIKNDVKKIINTIKLSHKNTSSFLKVLSITRDELLRYNPTEEKKYEMSLYDRAINLYTNLMND